MMAKYLYILYLMAVSIWYQTIWHTQDAMWEHAVEVSPECPRANLNRARRLMLGGDYILAMHYYELTLAGKDKHLGCWHKYARKDLEKYGVYPLEKTFKIIKYAGKKNWRWEIK